MRLRVRLARGGSPSPHRRRWASDEMNIFGNILSVIAALPILGMMLMGLWLATVSGETIGPGSTLVIGAAWFLAYGLFGISLIRPKTVISAAALTISILLLLVFGNGMIYDPMNADSPIGTFACRRFFFPAQILITLAIASRWLTTRKMNAQQSPPPYSSPATGSESGERDDADC